MNQTDLWPTVEAPFKGRQVSSFNYDDIRVMLPNVRKVLFTEILTSFRDRTFTSEDLNEILGWGLNKISQRLTELEKENRCIVCVGKTDTHPQFRIFRLAKPEELTDAGRRQ